MLIENTLEGELNKVEIAIERLRQFEPPEGYYLAFSGGKDSQVIYEIAKMSGVKFDAHFNFTTVDPPEVLRFIKRYYPDVIWERPEKTMWQLIEKNHMPPTRIARYCCSYLKERGGEGRFVVTGVRASESIKRRKRQMVDMCYTKHKRILNPIIDWTEKDVWEFIKQRELPYCGLYDEGYKRIGCVMCPVQATKGMVRDMRRYPNFYQAYLKAFGKMLELNKLGNIKNNLTWQTPEDVANWWMYGKDKQIDSDTLFDEEQIFHY